jgi:hypothetical protein
MSRAPRGGNVDGVCRAIDRRPFESPFGLGILLPGCPHLVWGQRERGWALVGSFVGSLITGLWAWGTWLGWGLFAFAFITHITSVTDVLRQSSFPHYPSRTALVITSGGLGLFCYLPFLFILSLLAWPGFEPYGTGSGFLVNCWAYRASEPRQGQWIWMRLPPSEEPRAAQVVAVSGQEVEWTGRNWRVEGKEKYLHSPLRLTAWPQACRFKVPANQVLVEPEDDGVSTPPVGPLVLVSPDRIIGRAWAQFYPVWDRRLL